MNDDFKNAHVSNLFKSKNEPGCAIVFLELRPLNALIVIPG